MSKYEAVKDIGVTSKMFLPLQQHKSSILQLQVGQKKNTYGRSAKLLVLQKKLYEYFLEMCKLGSKICKA